MQLKEYLKKNKIKIRDFSKRLGITEVYLSELIRGKKSPSWGLALKIVKETKGQVSFEDLGLFFGRLETKRNRKYLRERAFPVGPFPIDYSGIQEEETAGQLGQNGGQSGESAGQLYKPAGQSGQNDGQTGKTARGKSNPVKFGKENELSENRGGER